MELRNLLIMVTLVFVLSTVSAAMGQNSYMDAATQVIKENNRIDAEIADVTKNAYVTIRPYHVNERLAKVNKDSYAMWPTLFAKEVPDKYSDLYLNLKKLVKLQMKRSCLLYDAYNKGWMENRDRAACFKEDLKKIEVDYFKQKKLVDGIYENLQNR